MKKNIEDCDILLVGAGIMSATLATLIKELFPFLKIIIVEKLNQPALESSGALNNAGTGHAGFCELNYTPFINGSIDISKAVEINESFKKSKQFWSYLVNKGIIDSSFIHRVPHMSFVEGAENVYLLKKRWEALKAHHMFSDMEFSEDIDKIKEWAPLIVDGRKNDEPIAATRMNRGTDIDFGNLTNQLIKSLSTFADIKYNTSVKGLKMVDDLWDVVLSDGTTIITPSIFVGAGGAALTLLQKSKIDEIKGYGGFPVSGKWLVCDKEEIVSKHEAKVYGKASVGAPPMSVPHLDTRLINGKKSLLFGPYAGFSTKFLKTGNPLDLFRSINLNNIGTMLKAAITNFGLTKYLITEVLKGRRSKFKTLVDYYPNANKSDWKEFVAGQRVQVIKMEHGKAVIEFGTEVVGSSDGSIVGLLGASPGASTAVSIMVDVIRKMFGEVYVNEKQLAEMIPSINLPLSEDGEMFKATEIVTSKTLNLI